MPLFQEKTAHFCHFSKIFWRNSYCDVFTDLENNVLIYTMASEFFFLGGVSTAPN